VYFRERFTRRLAFETESWATAERRPKTESGPSLGGGSILGSVYTNSSMKAAAGRPGLSAIFEPVLVNDGDASDFMLVRA
jgi:hypothetical protein